jgi:hypothetical protein
MTGDVDLRTRLEYIQRLTTRLLSLRNPTAEARRLANEITRELEAARLQAREVKPIKG